MQREQRHKNWRAVSVCDLSRPYNSMRMKMSDDEKWKRVTENEGLRLKSRGVADEHHYWYPRNPRKTREAHTRFLTGVSRVKPSARADGEAPGIFPHAGKKV